jgi:hypothetical protein
MTIDETTGAQTFEERLGLALGRAKAAAETAAKAYAADAPRAPDGFIRDVSGFAQVGVIGPSTRLRDGLIAAGASRGLLVSGVFMLSRFYSTPPDQSLSLAEAAARAAVEVLKDALPADGIWTIESKVD